MTGIRPESSQISLIGTCQHDIIFFRYEPLGADAYPAFDSGTLDRGRGDFRAGIYLRTVPR